MAEEADLQPFLAFSVLVTGYDEFRLQGTGQAEHYLSTVMNVVGESATRELLEAYGRISGQAAGSAEVMDNLLRAEIMNNDKLGPIARNIIKLWFVGTWYQLPAAWRAAYGVMEADTTFVASAEAYTEGLLWPTIDANPPGAKGPGYGNWTGPPRINLGD